MIYTIANQKGGVGKSTLVVNLAVAWKKAGYSIVIVEADPTIYTASNWAADREEAGYEPILTLQKTGRLNKSLTELDTKYDIVLVDLAGKDSAEMRSALMVSDVTIVPCQPSQPDSDGTVGLSDILEEVVDYNPKLQVLFVVNRASTHPGDKEAAQTREILAGVYDNVLETVIRQRKAFGDSLSEGLGVLEWNDPKAQDEITSLVAEIDRFTSSKESPNA